jgi:ABC-type glutathione transport system ATPase component
MIAAMSAAESDVLLEARGLRKTFPAGRGSAVRAVDGVSFSVRAGEIVGIVGESGCGKSTTARLIMHLIRPDEGELRFEGATAGTAALPLKAFRRQAQMVFQDSHASLNPRLAVVDSVAFGAARPRRRSARGDDAGAARADNGGPRSGPLRVCFPA